MDTPQLPGMGADAKQLAKKQRRVVVDGKRKRRHSENKAKRRYYARYRSLRFARRYGSVTKNQNKALEKDNL